MRTIKNLSIHSKFTLVVTAITFFILLVNIFLFNNINDIIARIDAVYDSNLRLNELTEVLDNVQGNMTDYLNTKSTESMENYYRYEQELKDAVSGYNTMPSKDPLLMYEKNIRNLTDSYLDWTAGAIEAKRGRNVEKYRNCYDNAQELHGYISEYIFSFNNEKFRENARIYSALSQSLKTIETLCVIIYVIVAVVGLLIVTVICNTITTPLRGLVDAAKKVSEGDYEVELTEASGNDEVSVVANAFNRMVRSIKENIVAMRRNLEREQQMKEKELMMEAHLKDARLKYLQAQINPHFLFNTLNAGAQLAMMEDADRTYDYIQKVAAFFRYNIKKDNDEVSLRDEIALVDTYIYILNVRFSGEIGYEKHIDESLLDTRLPGMCLQPIVENSVNYGIRDINRKGEVTLSVYRSDDDVCISIRDNGIGMTRERINEVFSRKGIKNSEEADSNGIGLNNVMSRIELMYGGTDVMDIISDGPDTGTEIRLYVPYTEAE